MQLQKKPALLSFIIPFIPNGRQVVNHFPPDNVLNEINASKNNEMFYYTSIWAGRCETQGDVFCLLVFKTGTNLNRTGRVYKPPKGSKKE